MLRLHCTDHLGLHLIYRSSVHNWAACQYHLPSILSSFLFFFAQFLLKFKLFDQHSQSTNLDSLGIDLRHVCIFHNFLITCQDIAMYWSRDQYLGFPKQDPIQLKYFDLHPFQISSILTFYYILQLSVYCPISAVTTSYSCVYILSPF